MRQQSQLERGTNHAVRLGLMTQALALASTPVTIVLVATQLTPHLQGYYFTMASLLALQVLIELGLSTVLTQFFSHEFVRLRWRTDGLLGGAREARQRARDILLQSIAWFTVAGCLLCALLAPLGIQFFEAGAIPRSLWLLPWLLAVAGVAANLLLLPLIALESGSGNIEEMSRCEVRSSLVATPVAWALLASGLGLFGMAATSIIRFAFFFAYFLSRRHAFLRSIWRQRGSGGRQTSWRQEIWPMQWRVSLSSASAYLVLQLITPAIFHFQGATEAGRMGMSMAAFSALATIGLTIVNVRAAHLGHLVASGNWHVVDPLFSRTAAQGLGITLAGAVAGTLVVFLLQQGTAVGDRFIPYWQIGALLAGACLQVAVSHLGVYLRAYKRDPLMPLTLAHGAAQGGATLLLAQPFGTAGIAMAIPAIYAVILPAAIWIWWRCRHEWQLAPGSRAGPGPSSP